MLLCFFFFKSLLKWVCVCVKCVVFWKYVVWMSLLYVWLVLFCIIFFFFVVFFLFNYYCFSKAFSVQNGDLCLYMHLCWTPYIRIFHHSMATGWLSWWHSVSCICCHFFTWCSAMVFYLPLPFVLSFCWLDRSCV